MKPLNLFYEEPDEDRWMPYDRYPRRLIRRIVRGKPPIGGMMRYFVNLCAGLDKINVPYRVNQYQYIQKHPSEIACVLGKSQILCKIKWKNPILFGPAGYSHPYDAPMIFEKFPIQKILVSCEWMKDMCGSGWNDKVSVWASGIDTYQWEPAPLDQKDIDVLIYDKVRWDSDRYKSELINPIQLQLQERGLKTVTIRYGYYKEEEFRSLLNRCKTMIFLCEHETQGFAYQQVLACDIPILAWDRGGFWQDQNYYPHRVKFSPVSSVPYWDNRCGVKFKNIDEFPASLDEFLAKLNQGLFSPRNYILENLSLEKCAKDYLKIVHALGK